MTIEPFEYADLDFLANFQPEGWSKIPSIFEYYLASEFCFPIKIVSQDTMLGIGAAIIHHETAWLGHIIVAPEHRNKGVGRLITQTLVEQSQAKNCRTIILIATEMGAPVYKKVGFETDNTYLFFKDIVPNPNWIISENCIPYSENYNNQIALLDLHFSKENRFFHLIPHLSDAILYVENNKVLGYYLPTFFDGPIAASTPLAGIELMKCRFQTKDHAILPEENLDAINFLHQLGYQEYRTAKRMWLGEKKDWLSDSIYNRISGNLG